ncbi:MAG TPA: c-type cytochrome, partial [Gammaproteobacteria bacterium]|nr:c-type cytochrome [Gammaproteobacteria bacterium]
VAVTQPLSGEAIYKKSCSSCHATGAANAPKLGDKAAWKPRIAKGVNVLLQSAINGVPGTAMMKRGTCNSCSDDDLKAVVEYMVSQGQ